MLKNKNCCQTYVFICNFAWQFTTLSRQFLYRLFYQSVLIKVPYYALLYDDCSIRVYQSFTTIFHKCLILLLIFALHFPIMLALCSMLSTTRYALNYTGIIGGFLLAIATFKLPSHSFIIAIASYIASQLDSQ